MSIYAIENIIAEKLRAKAERRRASVILDMCARASLMAVWRNY